MTTNIDLTPFEPIEQITENPRNMIAYIMVARIAELAEHWTEAADFWRRALLSAPVSTITDETREEAERMLGLMQAKLAEAQRKAGLPLDS